MIASLPMYDWPEVRQATDNWWAGIARHLDNAPALDRGADYTALWRDPRLLFSQTCGYPFTHEFSGRLKLIATPHYGADGCSGKPLAGGKIPTAWVVKDPGKAGDWIAAHRSVALAAEAALRDD